ncbi:MAG: RidA family protein [Actinomycetaceae bacterium]|nr:RidA family protein [Actinomycetaceae bacterium]
MSSPSENLKALGLNLPEVAAPVAAYVPAVTDRGVVRTSGQLPFANGELLATGAVGEGGTDPHLATQAAKACALNCLAAAAAAAGGLDNLTGCVKVTGFVSSKVDFTGQPAVINGASELFGAVFGDAHARSAVGVAVLPLDASVEVEAEFSLA